jgi:hypothetical protein
LAYTDFVVFCFADHPHAQQFQARIGGEFIDPEDRPKWPERSHSDLRPPIATLAREG